MQVRDVIITRHRDTGKPKGCFVEFGSQVGCHSCRGLKLGCSRGWVAGPLLPPAPHLPFNVRLARGRPLAPALASALQDDLAKALTLDGEPMLRRPLRVQVAEPPRRDGFAERR